MTFTQLGICSLYTIYTCKVEQNLGKSVKCKRKTSLSEKNKMKDKMNYGKITLK